MYIYCDGAARGNNKIDVPTLCSVGIVVFGDSDKKNLIESRGYVVGASTNNESEYIAMIDSLQLFQEYLHRGYQGCCVIRCDSLLVANQLNGVWKCKAENLLPLYSQALSICNGLAGLVKIEHVKRKFNKEADAEANMALDTCCDVDMV